MADDKIEGDLHGEQTEQGWLVRKRSGGKSVWDWLALLIVPGTLIVLGFVLSEYQDSRQARIEEARADAQATVDANRANVDALQAYYGVISELLLDYNLKDEAQQEARIIAHARTLVVLRSLDVERKGWLVEFLIASDLIDIVSLAEADLSGANLSGANLTGADLGRANLTGADLSRALLTGANLGKANLTGAKLGGANLERANLVGARYDDESVWPEGLRPDEAGAVNVSP